MCFLCDSMNLSELKLLTNQLLALPGENEWIEFKENNMNPEEVGKRISALSNGACLSKQPYAYLIFGVEDETKKIVGTKSHFRQQKKGKEDLEHWLAQRLNPRIDFKVYDFEYGDLKMSFLQIPSATNQPVRFLHEAYVRVGSYTRLLKDFPEKERKIWLNAPKEVFETQIAKSNVKKHELMDLLDIAAYYNLTRQPLPPDTDTIIRKFVEEKLIIQKGIDHDITNLCAILFARDLHHFDGLYRKAVRVVVYKNNSRIETEREYTGNKGYALAFTDLIEFLDIVLPKNEIIEKSLRKNVNMYPEIALRELIANALIHQDFSVKGTGPMIEIFKNRIEITNPGKPLIDVLRFIDHNPVSRNEKLAYLMRRLNICEERGSGIDKVIDACEFYQLPAPEFIEADGFTRIKLFATQNLRHMDKTDKIRACYQHCALKYVSGEKMTNSSLRVRFDIEEKNYSMASRIISETINEELVKDADPDSTSKKNAKYIPFWA